MKNIGIIFLFILRLSNTSICQQSKDLNAAEFKALLEKTPSKIVLDVRTDGEVAQGVLPQATQIDYNSSNFESQIEKLDKNKPIFIYCAAGGRSGNACKIFSKKGFKQVYNLSGGINGWRASGYPVTRFQK